MNAVVNSGQVPQAVKSMVVLVAGKVQEVRRHEKTIFTRVIAPAADEYSKPQIVEIRSQQRIGERGDVIKQLCRLGGYEGRPFNAVDKSTGESRTARRCDLTLDAME